jgi:hypothetical protein
LASIAEILHALYRAYLESHGVRRSAVPKQLKVPRPRDMQPRRRATHPDEVRAVIAAAWGGGGHG